MLMMNQRTDSLRRQTWLNAVAEAAKLQDVELPPFDEFGMGALRSTATRDGRFVTLKKRIAPRSSGESTGVEWALWHQVADRPVLVGAFRESLEPGPEGVATTLSLLKGWL